MRPVTLNTSDASGVAKTSLIFPPDVYLNPFDLSIQAEVTGAATYTVEWTQDDIWAATFDAAAATWNAVDGMNAAVANATATFGYPVRGFRLRQTAGAGSVAVKFVQAGAVG